VLFFINWFQKNLYFFVDYHSTLFTVANIEPTFWGYQNFG